MVSRYVRALRLFLGVLAGIMSLPVVCAGVWLLWNLFILNRGEEFYVGSPISHYLWMGVFYSIAGVLALWGSVHEVRRRTLVPGLLTLACFGGLGLGSMILFAKAHRLPLQIANALVVNNVLDVGPALSHWAEKHGRFPMDESEFQAAVANLQLKSPFQRADAVFPHRFLYVGQASGPVRSPTPPQYPGTIVCAFSPDGRQVWVTATTLQDPVGHKVVWLDLFGRPFFSRRGVPSQWYRSPK